VLTNIIRNTIDAINLKPPSLIGLPLARAALENECGLPEYVPVDVPKLLDPQVERGHYHDNAQRDYLFVVCAHLRPHRSP
jgi:hypothetical protein